LYSSNGGNLEAIIEANYMGMVRTGAANAVASRWMSREDSEIVSMFGAGWQANGQLEALCLVRPLKRAKIFDTNKSKLINFCRRNQEKLGIKVLPCGNAEEALEDADIVTTITTSTKPVFSNDFLKNGTHINAAGSNSLIRTELEEATLRAADVIAVDAKDVAAKECGDLLPLLEHGYVHWNQIIELGDIVASKATARATAEQITVFESHGMCIQDLSVATRVLEIARENNVGKELTIGR
jgi:ornithine cyclodeaminase